MQRVAALLLLLAMGCNPSASPVTPSPTSPVAHSVAGGCAGTVLTDDVPPTWAQAGWSHTAGAPWPVPWAKSGDAVAFVFATHLVAGPSPRVDGSANKVLWLLKGASAFSVEGRPLGKQDPVVTVDGGPSIVDAPMPGCWSFQMIPRGSRQPVSTINLDVLPTGTDPAK